MRLARTCAPGNLRCLAPLLALVFLSSCVHARVAREGADDAARTRDEIVRMFQHGATAWNAGRLDDFMSDYLDEARTTYIGSRGLVRGRSAIRNVYAPRFAPGAQRDSLRFENIEVDVLAPGVANAIGWYVLYRNVGGRDSVTARGPTSLVVERVDGRWMIIHDHSS